MLTSPNIAKVFLAGVDLLLSTGGATCLLPSF